MSGHEDVVVEDVQLGALLLPLAFVGHRHRNQVVSEADRAVPRTKKNEQKSKPRLRLDNSLVGN